MNGAGFEAAIARRLDAVRLAVRARLAERVPPDVTVTLAVGGIAFTGRALSLRALADPRLRDFAGLLR